MVFHLCAPQLSAESKTNRMKSGHGDVRLFRDAVGSHFVSVNYKVKPGAEKSVSRFEVLKMK